MGYASLKCPPLSELIFVGRRGVKITGSLAAAFVQRAECGSRGGVVEYLIPFADSAAAFRTFAGKFCLQPAWIAPVARAHDATATARLIAF